MLTVAWLTACTCAVVQKQLNQRDTAPKRGDVQRGSSRWFVVWAFGLNVYVRAPLDQLTNNINVVVSCDTANGGYACSDR